VQQNFPEVEINAAVNLDLKLSDVRATGPKWRFKYRM